MKKHTWTLRAELDETGAWTGQIAEEPGAITCGRSLRQLQSRMRDALSLMLNRELTAADELVLKVALPKPTESKIARATEFLEKVQKLENERRATLRAVVVDLSKRGFSTRDSAEVLGISHQRVSQLMD